MFVITLKDGTVDVYTSWEAGPKQCSLKGLGRHCCTKCQGCLNQANEEFCFQGTFSVLV